MNTGHDDEGADYYHAFKEQSDLVAELVKDLKVIRAQARHHREHPPEVWKTFFGAIEVRVEKALKKVKDA